MVIFSLRFYFFAYKFLLLLCSYLELFFLMFFFSSHWLSLSLLPTPLFIFLPLSYSEPNETSRPYIWLGNRIENETQDEWNREKERRKKEQKKNKEKSFFALTKLQTTTAMSKQHNNRQYIREKGKWSEKEGKKVSEWVFTDAGFSDDEIILIFVCVCVCVCVCASALSTISFVSFVFYLMDLLTVL